MAKEKFPIIVIGAGAAGLVVALGATRAGKHVLMIEKGHYGGDCTNFGCIPSKSLIASAEIGHAKKAGQKMGVYFDEAPFQASDALKRVRSIVAEVRSHEDKQALIAKGVETWTGQARFLNKKTLEVHKTDGEIRTVCGSNIIIATGSHPFIPSIPGLDQTPYLTNETIFDLEKIPKTLAVMGGGPIGSELAMAFSRLGSKVTLIHSHKEMLAKEEIEAQEVIAKKFEEEGIELCLGYGSKSVTHSDNQFTIELFGKEVEGEKTIQVEKLLVATGRRPTIKELQLDAAGVKHTDKSIEVDQFGRTTQKHIWAVGDVLGGPYFTHYAEAQARTVLTSLILPLGFKKKLPKQPIPRVTYTDPEIASIGLSEFDAQEKFGKKDIATYFVPFSEVDRAITSGREEGFVKIVTKKWSSKILGCTIAAPRAGEMLMQISTAMHAKLPLRKLASLIHPYPTYSLAIRRAADKWLAETLLNTVKKK